MEDTVNKTSPAESGQEKRRLDFKYVRKLVIYCKKYVPPVIVTVVFSVLANAGSIAGPKLISRLTDTMTKGISGTMDMDALKSIFIALVIIYSISTLLNYAQTCITKTVTVRVTENLRSDLIEKISRLPLRFFDSSIKGDTLSKVTNDVSVMSSTLSECAPSLLKALVLFFGVLVMMLKSSVIFTLVTVGISLLGFVSSIMLVKKSQKYFDRTRTLLGKMNGHIEETFTNHTAVTAFGAQGKERAVFADTSRKLCEAEWKSQVISGFMSPIMSLCGNITYLLVFTLGVSQIVRGNSAMTLGTIVSFTLYARSFSSPLQTIAQTISTLQQTSAASKRVFEILDSQALEDESEKTAVLSDVRGDVEFRNVSFGYLPEKTVIHDFSAKLRAGQKVAIVGPTGAGKTTIVNLLMRFYEPDSGDIRIDGVSIKDMKRESVHELFDMILQDTWLFTGTIRENLVFNRPDTDDARLDAVCEAVGLRHFIETLPQGYDTPISESLNLSEGQKQQLTIARAMVQNSPLLILDEATSSVDSRTEIMIQRAMDELTKGRTSFVIAHRLSTIKNADVILVMRDGDIVESGGHDELMAQNGFYARLYNSQFAPVE